MTTTIRLPLGQFEFIEQTFDRDMSPEDAIEAFKALQKAYQGGPGLPENEWRDFLTEWFNTGTVVEGTEAHARMSPQQQWCVNEYKKTLKRIKYKV